MKKNKDGVPEGVFSDNKCIQILDLNSFEWKEQITTGTVPKNGNMHNSFIINDQMYVLFIGFNSGEIIYT